MAVLPKSRLDRVEFFEARLAQWAGSAAAIGILPAQAAQIATMTNAARAAFNAQQTQLAAAKAATASFYVKTDDMAELGSDLIKTIKAYAETTNNPNVYALASIPAPAAPTPAGAPTAPTALDATMNADGTITLKWKGVLAARQFFSIWRQLPGQNAPTQIGSIAAKSFIDTSVPRGLTQVVYSVRAHRDTLVSEPSDNIVVYFGAIGSGTGGNGESAVAGSIGGNGFGIAEAA
jgi:hypothetical protein